VNFNSDGKKDREPEWDLIRREKVSARPRSSIPSPREICGLEVFALSESPTHSLQLADPQPSARGNDPGPAGWLPQLQHRLLPVKAVCRALLNMQLESPEGILLADAHKRLKWDVLELGDRIYGMESKWDRGEHESWLTDFPHTSGGKGGNGKDFTNKFLGSFKKTGTAAAGNQKVEFISAVHALKLMECVGEGAGATVRMTRSGARFAQLPNPVIDQLSTLAHVPGGKFSDAEIECLLEHVLEFLPGALSAFRSLLAAVKEGAASPEDLDKHLEAVFRDTQGRVTDSALTKLRTAAAFRMTELDLIERQRSRSRITYSVTERGEAFLKRIS